MLLQESKHRQEMLVSYLEEMALTLKNEEDLKELAIKFQGIYSDGFRHDYSEFFSLIVEISREDNEYNLEYLSNNLVALREFVEYNYLEGSRELTSLYWPLLKLSDHINLEIGRYTYYSANEQELQDLEKRNKETQINLKEAAKQLEEARKKISSTQTDLIAVLSIFAAIVLTFSGSLSFLGNALTGMENAPFLKSVFFVSLCGLVVFNTVFLMMYLVAKITGRNIYAHCKSSDCTCNNGSPKCSGFNRIRKRLPYVFWGNILFLLFLLASVTLWIMNGYFDFLPFE